MSNSKNPKREYELVYEGKETEKEIIKNTPSANLKLSKTYGPKIKWSNLLIYGDNLPVLKMLLEDREIAGKVKLIYIDPPFATNQTFRGKKLQPSLATKLSS